MFTALEVVAAQLGLEQNPMSKHTRFKYCTLKMLPATLVVDGISFERHSGFITEPYSIYVKYSARNDNGFTIEFCAYDIEYPIAFFEINRYGTCLKEEIPQMPASLIELRRYVANGLERVRLMRRAA